MTPEPTLPMKSCRFCRHSKYSGRSLLCEQLGSEAYPTGVITTPSYNTGDATANEIACLVTASKCSSYARVGG